jgi:hypothetical protein
MCMCEVVWSCRVCWFSGNVSDLQPGAALCADTSCPGSRVTWFSTPLGRFRDSTGIIPRPLPSKSFSVHNSISLWHSIRCLDLNNNICRLQLFNNGDITPHFSSYFPVKDTEDVLTLLSDNLRMARPNLFPTPLFLDRKRYVLKIGPIMFSYWTAHSERN